MDSDGRTGKVGRGEGLGPIASVQGPQVGYLESCANGVERSASR